MKKFNLFLIVCALAFLAACTPTETSPPASLGNAGAPVLIEEFSDFQCPACAQLSPQIEEIVKRNPDKYRLEYHHYPLPYHEFAFKAGEAAECALDQGKFWEYGRIMFQNQENLTTDNLLAFAKQLSLDEDSFKTCLDGGTKGAKIKNDTYEGRRRQLSYTPSLYVNGTLVQFTDPDTFEQYLQSL